MKEKQLSASPFSRGFAEVLKLQAYILQNAGHDFIKCRPAIYQEYACNFTTKNYS
jgi:hypothetical protein